MREALTLSAITTLAIIAACPAFGQVNREMIQRVAAGEVTEARASWWGFDPEDATDALQAAIDSGAARVVVEDMGRPWIVRPIQLAGDQEVVFEEGVEILAKRGEFKGTNDCLFTARDVENVTLRGYGATFRMWQEDYDNRELYRKAEWRHCLQLRGARNVNVYGLTLMDSGGDGIYLGAGPGRTPNRDVHIKDVVCDNNYRQGISVITVENLLIEDTIMRNTSGTPPQAGIDFEPNRPEERLVNVVMRNCLTENNNSYGYVLYLRPLNAESEPVSVRFENCRSIGDHAGAARITTDASVATAAPGIIEFVDCEFRASGGPGITVTKPAAQGLARFVNCSVIDCGPNHPAPIVISSESGAEDPVGGVVFDRVRLRDPFDRDPMAYIDRGGGIPLEQIHGSLVLVDDEGNETIVELTDEQLGEWMPIVALRDIPRVDIAGMQFEPLASPAVAEEPQWPWRRRESTFAIHARAGETVSFLAQFAQVGRYSGDEMPVTIKAPSGAVVHETAVPFQDQATITFTAPETGLYRVVADPGPNRVMLSEASHPTAILGTGRPIRLMQYSGELQFYVPEGVKLFGVRISGEGVGEAVRAALVSPSGEVVDEVDNQVKVHQFEVELQEPSRGEIWTLRTGRPSASTWEDFYVDPRGVPPLLTPRGLALIVPAR